MSLGIVNNSNNGTVNSASGCVWWPAFQFTYKGTSYSAISGYTNYRYVYWCYANHPSNALTVTNSLYDSNGNLILTPDDWLLIVNKYGYGVDMTSDSTGLFGDLIVPGTIQAGALAADSVTSANIVAGTITSGDIAANTIQTANMVMTDSTNYCANPNVLFGAAEWNAPYVGGVPQGSGMSQVYAQTNGLQYTPSTWAEWTKSPGVSVASNAVTITADHSTSPNIKMTGGVSQVLCKLQTRV